MKNSVITLCLVLIAVAAYVERDQWMPHKTEIVYVPAQTPPPTPTPMPTPVRHLAPEGTFLMTEYVSTHTPHGMAGFVPGQEVKFVSVDRDKGTLLVTDGTYQVAVRPSQITNDLDLAALARQQDQDSQRNLQTAQEASRQAFLKATQDIDIAHAKDVDRLHTGAGIGTNSVLGQDSKAASSFDRSRESRGYYGNPYYYLQR